MGSNATKSVCRAETLHLAQECLICCGTLVPEFSRVDVIYQAFDFMNILKITSTEYRKSLLIRRLKSSISTIRTMRHKKDGFSAKGKKHSNAPRHRPTPSNEEREGQNRKPPFKAACWDLEHCDPKRCSGKRLMHFGLMRELSVGQKFQGVVIS